MNIQNPVKGAIAYWQYCTGKTAKDLAKELGVNTQTLYRWIRNNKVPLMYQKRVYEVTGVDLRENYLKKI